MAIDYCTHGRIERNCEDCAYQRAKEAGRPLGGPPPAETRTAAESTDAEPSAARRRR